MATLAPTSAPTTIYDLIQSLQDQIEATNTQVGDNAGEVDGIWVLIAGCLVFFMQLGFGMLESGTVRSKNVNNILFKNLMDASVGAVIWFAVGYAFAYGDGNDSGFIGAANFALVDDPDYGGWFFQWTFAAAAATIVSGSVAERCTINAYFIYSVCITGFIYPVVVHWVWDSEGWLSAFNPDASVQAMDFAGSGVVHMVGGFSGLMGAWIIGARLQPNLDKMGVSQEGARSIRQVKGHNIPQQVMGSLILWFGWYGFNCGSSLGITGLMGVVTRVACNTTMGAAGGCLSATLISRFATDGYWNVSIACNGALAGLVSITAGCACLAPGFALLAGIIGGIVYCFSSWFINDVCGIDDPLDASSVHGSCGFWGVIACGLFRDVDAVAAAYSEEIAALPYGKIVGNQFIEAVMVVVWSCGMSGLLFLAIKYTVGLRVSEHAETLGLDFEKHGGEAYQFGSRRSSRTMKELFSAKKIEEKDLDLEEDQSKPASPIYPVTRGGKCTPPDATTPGQQSATRESRESSGADSLASTAAGGVGDGSVELSRKQSDWL